MASCISRCLVLPSSRGYPSQGKVGLVCLEFVRERGAMAFYMAGDYRLRESNGKYPSLSVVGT